jgi:NTP pyrophosphatase (non-canonical NTP hydrolase)
MSECAMGTKLDGREPCPKCGAGPKETCGRWVTQADSVLRMAGAAIEGSLKSRGYKTDYASWSDRPEIHAEGEALTAIRALIGQPQGDSASFQARVDKWLLACFGEAIARDKTERNHRFIEEALELVQAGGCTASEAHQLVDYVFGRPVGEMSQEAGGVMNTLAALCLAHGIDLDAAAETELARVWTKVEQIRAKQAAKPKHSPLPEHVAPQGDAGTGGAAPRSEEQG